MVITAIGALCGTAERLYLGDRGRRLPHRRAGGTVYCRKRNVDRGIGVFAVQTVASGGQDIIAFAKVWAVLTKDVYSIPR